MICADVVVYGLRHIEEHARRTEGVWWKELWHAEDLDVECIAAAVRNRKELNLQVVLDWAT